MFGDLESHILKTNSSCALHLSFLEAPDSSFFGNRILDQLDHCVNHQHLLMPFVVVILFLQTILMCAYSKWSEKSMTFCIIHVFRQYRRPGILTTTSNNYTGKGHATHLQRFIIMVSLCRPSCAQYTPRKASKALFCKQEQQQAFTENYASINTLLIKQSFL